MKLSKPCPKLKDAVKFSFALQIPLMLLAGLATDGGMIGQICLFAFVGFNSYLLSVLIFRPHSPTKFDLFLVRVGFLPSIILAGYLANYIWDLRGY